VLYRTVVRVGRSPRRFGQWAVVTGATDGIGKALCFELARRGCSVFLISRSVEKLTQVKEELLGKYPAVEVRTMAADFSALSAERRSELGEALAKLDVGILFNNVGLSYPFCQWFHELSDAEVANLMTLNVESTTWMTRLVLPGMRERGRGAVVNMSSAAAAAPLPLLAQYSAAKSYIEMFTRSLSAEYAKDGLCFQYQAPLWVATNMALPNSKAPVESRATLAMPSATTYARCAVKAIGYEVESCPYWAHALYMWVQARLPDFLKVLVIYKMHLKVRFHKKNKELMAKKNKGE